MEQPNSQTTQPTASPASAVLPTLSPQPAPDVSPQVGMSNSDGNHAPVRKKLLLIGAGVLALVVLVFVAVLVYNLFNPFHTVNYNNGSGSQFTLKFYRGSSIKSADSLPPFSPGKPFSGAPFLVGPTKQNTALALRISKNTGKSLYENNSLCQTPAFKVTAKAGGQAGDVCVLRGGEKNFIYFFELKSGTDKYLVLILEDYDYVKANNDPTLAKKITSRIDLKKYDKDLQTILGSIKIKN